MSEHINFLLLLCAFVCIIISINQSKLLHRHKTRDFSVLQNAQNDSYGPHNSISNGYRGFFFWRWSGRTMRLTVYLRLVPR